MDLGDPAFASGLRKRLDQRAAQVAASLASHYAWRTVVDVLEPATPGKGGSAVVVDGLGQESTMRWFADRPAVDDVVLCEFPPGRHPTHCRDRSGDAAWRRLNGTRQAHRLP